MSENELERVHELKEKLHDLLHNLIEETVAGESLMVADAVLTQLDDEFRFWRRGLRK